MSSYEFEERLGPAFPPLGLISAWVGVFLISVTAVASLLAGASVRLWASPMMTSLQLALIVLLGGSLLHLFLRVGDGMPAAAVPLIINVGTLLIIHFVPFAGLWQEARFQWHWPAYNEVVQLVTDGALTPDEQGILHLPPNYRALTTDGATVRVATDGDVTRIFFYTGRQSRRRFAGYLYHSDDNFPSPGEFDGRWRTVVQKRPHWFYCVSY